MNTTETSHRPVNEKAIRRWINEGYEGAASCATWTVQECLDFVEEHHVHGLDAFRQTDYRGLAAYRNTSPAAQAAVDAVFNAVTNVASPALTMHTAPGTGNVDCSFTWHDGAQYRVEITRDGLLARLYRLELTGGWTQGENVDGDLVPDATWRTVRAFTKDRAGKVLAPALAGLPAISAWTRAVGL